MRFRRLRFGQLALAIILAGALMLGPGAALAESPAVQADALQTIIDLATKYHKDLVDPDAMRRGSIEGALRALGDPYTVYMDAKQYADFVESIEGELEGIGVYVEQAGNYVQVQSPIKGSPAAAAGLLPGDRILEVDGIDLVGQPLEKATSLIRGPAGTPVRLKLERPGTDAGSPRIFEVTVTRSRINVPVVDSELLSDQIGYVKIWTFSTDVPTKVRAAVTELLQQGAQGLIFDLRNNGGGYLEAARQLLEGFLPQRTTIVQMSARGRIQQALKTGANAEPYIKVPIVLLVNEHSASASEIFAGALQDYGLATIVGTRTFGKGTVQTLLQLGDGSMLKVTTEEYLTPKGRRVEGIGLTPDILVPSWAPPTGRFVNIPLDLAPLPGQVSLSILYLQQNLNDLGFSAGLENGVYNSTTQAAVKRLQIRRQLPVTGRIDPATAAALNTMLGEEAESRAQADVQKETALQVIAAEIAKNSP